MSDGEIRAEFLRRAGVTDHPYSRTPGPCCDRPLREHLGSHGNPVTLPGISEMRLMLAEHPEASR